MKLARWIEKQKITRAEFARRLGTFPSYISQATAPGFWPGRKMMQKIYQLTDKKVGPMDFLFDDNNDKSQK
jgi:transcriptional regulator with XRE-family HTH domain